MKKITEQNFKLIAGGIPLLEAQSKQQFVDINTIVAIAPGVILSYEEDGIFHLSSLSRMANFSVSGTVPKNQQLRFSTYSSARESVIVTLSRKKDGLSVHMSSNPHVT